MSFHSAGMHDHESATLPSSTAASTARCGASRWRVESRCPCLNG
jgi:hypothetical protein